MSKATRKVLRSDNLPNYTLDAIVNDMLSGAKVTNKAEAGMIVALFGEEQWKLPALKEYFAAPTSETDPVTKKVNKNARTRLKIQNAFLSRFGRYQSTLDDYNHAVADVKTAKAAKNTDNAREAAWRGEKHGKVLRAMQAMFHRAMMALFHLRNIPAVKVELGANNEIIVSMADKTKDDQKNEDGAFNATTLRAKGQKKLDAAKLIKRRAPRPNTLNNAAVKALSAVDANTAKPVIAALGELFDKDTFNPPIETESENVVDKNDIAELALRIVGKLKKADMKNDELRSTVSQIIVPLMSLLDATTLAQVRKYDMTGTGK